MARFQQGTSDVRLNNIADGVNAADAVNLTQLNTKQDTLVAGTNITIDPDTNTISATGGSSGTTVAANPQASPNDPILSTIDIDGTVYDIEARVMAGTGLEEADGHLSINLDPDDGLMINLNGELSVDHTRVVTLWSAFRDYDLDDIVFTVQGGRLVLWRAVLNPGVGVGPEFGPLDAYNGSISYSRGDMVTLGGVDYVYSSTSPSAGNTPSATSQVWTVITISGSDSDNTWLHEVFDITANTITATELNVNGNGNAGQLLTSDGDGSFSWGDPATGGGTSVAANAGGTIVGPLTSLRVGTQTYSVADTSALTIRVNNLEDTIPHTIADLDGINLPTAGITGFTINTDDHFSNPGFTSGRDWVFTEGNPLVLQFRLATTDTATLSTGTTLYVNDSGTGPSGSITAIAADTANTGLSLITVTPDAAMEQYIIANHDEYIPGTGNTNPSVYAGDANTAFTSIYVANTDRSLEDGIMLYNGTTREIDTLTVGAAGTVLTSGGPTADPTWEDAGGISEYSAATTYNEGDIAYRLFDGIQTPYIAQRETTNNTPGTPSIITTSTVTRNDAAATYTITIAGDFPIVARDVYSLRIDTGSVNAMLQIYGNDIVRTVNTAGTITTLVIDTISAISASEDILSIAITSATVFTFTDEGGQYWEPLIRSEEDTLRQIEATANDVIDSRGLPEITNISTQLSSLDNSDIEVSPTASGYNINRSRSPWRITFNVSDAGETAYLAFIAANGAIDGNPYFIHFGPDASNNALATVELFEPDHNRMTVIVTPYFQEYIESLPLSAFTIERLQLDPAFFGATINVATFNSEGRVVATTNSLGRPVLEVTDAPFPNVTIDNQTEWNRFYASNITIDATTGAITGGVPDGATVQFKGFDPLLLPNTHTDATFSTLRDGANESIFLGSTRRVIDGRETYTLNRFRFGNLVGLDQLSILLGRGANGQPPQPRWPTNTGGISTFLTNPAGNANLLPLGQTGTYGNTAEDYAMMFLVNSTGRRISLVDNTGETRFYQPGEQITEPRPVFRVGGINTARTAFVADSVATAAIQFRDDNWVPVGATGVVFSAEAILVNRGLSLMVQTRRESDTSTLTVFEGRDVPPGLSVFNSTTRRFEGAQAEPLTSSHAIRTQEELNALEIVDGLQVINAGPNILRDFETTFFPLLNTSRLGVQLATTARGPNLIRLTRIANYNDGTSVFGPGSATIDSPTITQLQQIGLREDTRVVFRVSSVNQRTAGTETGIWYEIIGDDNAGTGHLLSYVPLVTGEPIIANFDGNVAGTVPTADDILEIEVAYALRPNSVNWHDSFGTGEWFTLAQSIVRSI